MALTPVNLHFLKERLVGRSLGHTLMRIRASWRLWRIVVRSPEQGGFTLQDNCAKAMLPHLLVDDAVFLDVGAHLGSVTASVLVRHPAERIIAIEAVPEKAARLRLTFPQITVHDCAVGDHEGNVMFVDDQHQSGCSSIEIHSTRADRNGVRRIHVPLRRLDSLVSHETGVDVIKLDIEGAELAALRGAEQLVARCRPLILFESGPHASDDAEAQLRELYDWFAQHDYEVVVPNRLPHEGPGLSEDGFVESHYYPFRTLDYFAVPQERRIEFRRRARLSIGIGT